MKKVIIQTVCVIAIMCISYTGGYFSASRFKCDAYNVESNIIVDSMSNMSAHYYGRKQMQKEILVPNELTAAKIALAVLEEKYGSGIYEEIPFRVMCNDSIWIVETSLPNLEGEDSNCDDDTQTLLMNVGGVGHVEINRNDGVIYCAYHTK